MLSILELNFKNSFGFVLEGTILFPRKLRTIATERVVFKWRVRVIY